MPCTPAECYVYSKAAIVSPAPAEWNVQIGLIGPRLDMVDCRYFQIS
jgi:hypothetical protein